MSGFKIRILTAGPHVVNDLGITLDSAGAAPVTEDHTSLPPQDVARSADLLALIASDDILIVDTRDDSDTTIMSRADSTEAVSNHNDTHFGVTGGRFGPADDPTATFTDSYVLEYDAGTDTWDPVPHEHLFAGQGDTIGEIIAGMGIDGTDTTFNYTASDKFLVGQGIQDETYYDGDTDFLNGAFFGGTAGYVVSDTITLSDGSVVTVDAVAAGVVTAFTVTTSGETVVTEGVALTQTSTSGVGTGFTLTPEARNTTPGSIEWSADDVWLRNTGDTLDSGTLTIASGAAVDFPTGSTITIAGDVTEASIQTPAGGFDDPDDLINKEYVDSLAGGFDYKESVRVSTTPADGDILAVSFGSGTYTPAGGPEGTGEFTGIDLSAGTGDTIDGLNFTGTSSTGLVVGDRVLIKDQTDAKQNGIYEITAEAAGVVTLTRATDQDGSPASEVSGGNTTFVEDTTAINGSSVNSNTRWSVIGDGDLTLNTDDIDWTQTGGDGSTADGIGISRFGNILDLDVDDLATATIDTADSIAFHDAAGGTPESSGSITRKTTVALFLSDLDIVSGITSNGLIRRTADDTYEQIAIVEDTTAGLEGANVVNGGVGDTGNIEIGLDIQNLAVRSDAVDTSDRVAVWNSTSGSNEYYTIGEIAGAVSASDSFSTWARTGNGSGASLVADSSADTVTIDGGIGINLTFTPASDTMSIAFSNDGMANTAVVAADTVPFFDADNSGEPEFRSWTDIISDLGLLTSGNQAVFTTVAGDSGGPAVADTNTDTLNLIGATSGGITTVASDAPETVTFGLTGIDLATGAATLAPADFIFVNDSADTATTLAQKYTFTDMITDLGLLTGTNQVVFTSVTGDTGTATADDNADSLALEGATFGGITTVATDGPELVTFGLTPIDLTTGAATLELSDFIVVSDAADTATTLALKYTFTDVVEDLDIVHGITSNGIIVRTGSDTYASRSIVESTTAGQEGGQVNNGDGVSGNIEIGVDINNLGNSADDLAATDEAIIFDGTNNVSMTGQQIADGVVNILNLDNGLGFSTINGQEILTFDDPTRASKTLSIDSNNYTYSDNSLSDGSWIEIGNAVDTDAGHIMPFNGTLVGITAMSENPGAGNTYEIDLFINGALSTAGIATLTGAGVDTDVDMTLNIDFAQGDRLRLQVDQTAGTGTMQDTVVDLIVRWRA